jgi:photosystem II stability/assembly factor-like uncharacterized protein
MPRHHFGFPIITAIIAALLTVTAACSAGGASLGAVHEAMVRTSASSAAAAPAKPAKRIDVLSASFVSPSTGWLLAELPCAHQVNPCRTTALMRETVNGGRTWFAVPAPPGPPADMYQSSPPSGGVGRVLFTSTRDGWAAGPSLWRTTDGGATWRRVRVPGPVADFTVVGGRMFAVIGGCDSAGNCAYRGYAAAVGADTWRPASGTAVTGAGGSPVQLAVSGSVVYLLAITEGLGKPVLLAGTVTGSARWRPLPEPCAAAYSAAVAAAAGWLFLGCAGEPGAGNQLKTAYVSRDGGRKWHQVASPPFNGYLRSATMSPDGTVFLSGERMDVYISRDRGGRWHVSPSLASPAGLADAGFPMLAATLTDTFGVVIQQGIYTQQVWLTRDGGSNWTPATVH